MMSKELMVWLHQRGVLRGPRSRSKDLAAPDFQTRSWKEGGLACSRFYCLPR
jgi:hypothetical protein